MPDEQVATRERARHTLLLRAIFLASPCRALLGRPRGRSGICGHLLAEFRQGAQDRLGDLLEDVELADTTLMRLRAEEALAKANAAQDRYVRLAQEWRSLQAELARKRQEIDGVLTKVEPNKNRISLTLGDTKLALDGVALSKAVKIHLDGKECTIGDLKPGMSVSLRVEQQDDKSVNALEARTPQKKE